jgi:hypothetical protein
MKPKVPVMSAEILWESEAGSNISKVKINYLTQIAHLLIVNIDKKHCFCLSKINLRFKIGGDLVIEIDFVRDCLHRGVKDDPKLAVLFLYSLGGCTTIWGKIDSPEFEREDVAILLFFIHYFCSHLGMMVESVLIPFLKSQILVLAFFLKIKVGWAALIDDALDVITVFFRDVRGG